MLFRSLEPLAGVAQKDRHAAETTPSILSGPASLQLLTNRRFEDELKGWNLREPSPVATVEATVSKLPSRPAEPAVQFDIIKKTGVARWEQLRFAQRAVLPRSALIEVQATLECDKMGMIRLGLVPTKPPYSPNWLYSFELTPGQPRDVRIDTVKVLGTAETEFVLDFGFLAEGARLWLANPSVKVWK